MTKINVNDWVEKIINMENSTEAQKRRMKMHIKDLVRKVKEEEKKNIIDFISNN